MREEHIPQASENKVLMNTPERAEKSNIIHYKESFMTYAGHLLRMLGGCNRVGMLLQ
jgi:hypothetical protein